MKKFALTVLAAACLSAPVHAFDLGAMIGAGTDLVKSATLSDADVKAMAAESSVVMDKKNKVAPASNAYSKRLAKMVKGLDSEDGTKLNFKVYLTKEVNAFAMADGTVRVYSGLMDKMNDDEVRFVIGHEIGHVKLGHTKKAMQLAYATSAARKGAAGSGNSVASSLSESELGGFAEAVVNAQFSQSQESDADAYSVGFLKRHNYNVQGGPAALRKLADLYGNDSSLLSSHPAPGDRAVKLEKQIQGM
ncbi:putative metalloprotease [Chromobacterium alkanivorans]|uniref:M48 family metallopeptidase n=1 Tax=Chromobacterium TaxID=535 RepID=UPI0009E4463F|nr:MULTISPECIES: M48 family metallopeptidase [Chromobacterium]MBN3002329.1 M48 family metallopeptidase [Chromobacterium alkanivorans]MCS3803534.1 putative metalloprotease [Chromobacterium alkanivorans]MCS3817356.1 putative metalloprotease [Chromobacterium alkanivorans]MCS3872900.1 putative metalloprotease [Chromobacterium alkanivorans]